MNETEELKKFMETNPSQKEINDFYNKRFDIFLSERYKNFIFDHPTEELRRNKNTK